MTATCSATSTRSCYETCNPLAMRASSIPRARSGPHPFRWTVSNLSFRPLIFIQRIPQRSLFRMLSRNHTLPDGQGPKALTATDERGPDGREGTDARDHHVFHIVGIYRPIDFPRTRSSLRLVSRAVVCGPGRRRASGARLSRHLFRAQRKYVFLCDHRIGPQSKGDINWPVRGRAAPDVRRSPCYAFWHADCARFVVGIARPCLDDACADLETIRRGEIPSQEPARLRGVPTQSAVSPDTAGLVTLLGNGYQPTSVYERPSY